MGVDPLPLSREKRVDAACDRFEAEWRAGKRPRVEEYLPDVTDPDYSALLRELLALDIELRSGDADRPGPDEYQARFPDHVEVIQAVFAAMPEPIIDSPMDGSDGVNTASYTPTAHDPALDTSRQGPQTRRASPLTASAVTKWSDGWAAGLSATCTWPTTR
jgi:hypothetical protein